MVDDVCHVCGVCVRACMFVCPEDAASTLSHLANNIDNHEWIKEAGGIVPLVRLMQGGSTTRAKEAASRTLQSLVKRGTS